MLQLAGLQQTLIRERQSKVEAAPVQKYDNSFRRVNYMRAAVGLEALSESHACLAAREMKKDQSRCGRPCLLH